ncbi:MULTISPECIES: acyl carrier protein [unclassified Micromonospora]|uniref:acyl carrier protein n=1 Tax=unclassified Micromonospora TaxID=2617518 RepID=UPI003626A3E8
MDKNQIRAVVRDVAHQVQIDLPDDVVRGGGRFEDLGVDSLTVIDLLNRVETTFDIEIPDSALYSIDSIDQLVDHIAEAVV